VSAIYCKLCVQAMLTKADRNDSSDINFAEFVEYMREHEQKLKLAFSDLDRNKDGKASFVIFGTLFHLEIIIFITLCNCDCNVVCVLFFDNEWHSVVVKC